RTVVVAVKLPDVPIIVTVDVPVAADALAVKVNALVLVVGFGTNPAVTPLGKPDAVRVTLPVKPFSAFTVIVLVPLFPCTTLKLVGLADSVKLGLGVTVSRTVVVAVKLPDVPIIVTVDVPVAADALAVKVNALVLVVGFGTNPAVTPLGNPDALRLTLPVKPFSAFTVIVLVPLFPCTMLKLVGLADSVKLGLGVTVRLTVVVAAKFPDVPVIVTVDVPVAADALAVKVKVLVPVVGFGANPAVTPLGKPDAFRLTLPVKPFSAFTAIVLVPLFPCTTLKLVELADSVKLGLAVTVSLTVVVWVKLPDVPVIVTVAVPGAADALAVSVKVLV